MTRSDTQAIALDALSRIMRVVPNSLPGKTRLARLVLRPFSQRHPFFLSDRFGNRLAVPSLKEPISVGLFACGVYEPDTVTAVVDHLNAYGTFLDVGANIGAVALPVAVRRPAAQIICIEADPGIASLLQKNVEANRRPNIRIAQCVAGPENVEIDFYAAPAANFGMGSVGPQFYAAGEKLRQRKLDDVLDELGIDNVDIAKFDIEGAELGAFKGFMRRLTGDRPPVIVFEFADWAESRIPGQIAGSAQNLLLSCGYSLFRMMRGGTAVGLEQPMTSGGAMILAVRARIHPTRELGAA